MSADEQKKATGYAAAELVQSGMPAWRGSWG
jgi:hypothetical protein